QRLIGEMPEAGRDAYELQFGARAQQMLTDAAAAGDISELEAVTRRYFHTRAGYQATMLLGRHHLDHDQPLAAAFCFQRLSETPAAASKLDPMLSILLAVSWDRTGMPERAEETLTALKKRDPNAKLRIADKPIRLFADEKQSLAWLESTMGKPAKAAP